MIRHLAELGAFLLLFAVGVGLMAAMVVGLLLIWKPMVMDDLEEEYKRVENEGINEWHPITSEELEALWHERPLEMADIARFAYLSRPYNWATREPMIWSGGNQ